jgi:Fe-S cluster assembly iron-binding protein IscA
LALDEPKDNEKPVDINGIGVLIADVAEPWVDGTTVDYIKNNYREGFTVTGLQESC